MTCKSFGNLAIQLLSVLFALSIVSASVVQDSIDHLRWKAGKIKQNTKSFKKASKLIRKWFPTVPTDLVPKVWSPGWAKSVPKKDFSSDRLDLSLSSKGKINSTSGYSYLRRILTLQFPDDEYFYLGNDFDGKRR